MLSALSFLTVVGPGRAPGPTTLRWFPIVGALIGLVVAGAHRGAHQLWAPGAAGLIVVAIDLALTGALHVDGLADSADGLLPHLDRRRRLEVMAEPTVGVFAVVTVVVTVALRWAVLADPLVDPLAIVALWALSRTLAATVPMVLVYAKPVGLASSFLSGAHPAISLAILPAVVALMVADGALGAVAAASAMAAAWLIAAAANRRLAGFTGDVLGAIIVSAETVGLVLLAVRT